MAQAAPPPIKIPRTLGAVVDLYYTTRERRLKLQKEVDAVEAQEKALAEHLINHISKQDSKGVSGKLAHVKINTSQVPIVKDWDAFYRYVIKTKDFSLLQKRLGVEAVRERWDAGVAVPGVEAFTVVKPSISKL